MSESLIDTIMSRAMARYGRVIEVNPGIPLTFLPDPMTGVKVIYGDQDVTVHLAGESVHPDYCCPGCRVDPCVLRSNMEALDRIWNDGKGSKRDPEGKTEKMTREEIRNDLFHFMVTQSGKDPTNMKVEEKVNNCRECAHRFIKEEYNL